MVEAYGNHYERPPSLIEDEILSESDRYLDAFETMKRNARVDELKKTDLYQYALRMCDIGIDLNTGFERADIAYLCAVSKRTLRRNAYNLKRLPVGCWSGRGGILESVEKIAQGKETLLSSDIPLAKHMVSDSIDRAMVVYRERLFDTRKVTSRSLLARIYDFFTR